ncbi:MAG TPA: DUF1998 domain-containing protein [Verrucomicrobiae bacterium]|nr:DUF1998 domain-containing protein [Verrucomicrobiae bacterium]
MRKSEIRSSQLLTTFGPGAMMDLPEGSVIIGGLDNWRFSPGAQPLVQEARLVAKLRARMEKPTLVLKSPPPSTDDPTAGKPGVVVWKFPRWFLVQNSEPLVGRNGNRRRLVPESQLVNGRYREGADNYDVVPVRFVRACEHGHVDDIDWPAFIHGFAGGCGGSLNLEERSTTGALVDVWATCSCGEKRSLAQAAVKGSKALGRCNGARPWLGSYSHETCDQLSRLLIRSASNAYFSQTLSVISIPDRKAPLDEVVKSLWDDGLSVVATNAAVLPVMRQIPKIATRLAGISDADILASVVRVAAGVAQFADRPVKEVEFEAFAEAAEELGSDQPDGDFFARALPKTVWDAQWMAPIKQVVLVHRLREVVAQVGFTRFESLSADINGELPDELSLNIKAAPLARDADWLPAVENRGEGVFLLFDASKIPGWLQKPVVQTRSKMLLNGFSAWEAAHLNSSREFPGVPYYLLHTFSHLLMTAISLDCGYPASSLRERIYALPAEGVLPDRYGILIFTGSSDAEGTLGGLVEAARRIKDFTRKALELASLCSNDPICAHHQPGEHDHAPLLGAACHGCLLVPETSCEQRNEFLDRGLAVCTVEGCGAEFFNMP